MTEITASLVRKQPVLVAPALPRSVCPTRARLDATADHRFADLLGPDAWARLPLIVQRRFSRKPTPGASRVFVGTVVETRLSALGRMLAQVARLVGGPLPFVDRATGPASVVVTESAGLGGQVWTRTYSRPGHFPQTINSVKRFAGPTGIEEYLGLGLVMRLRLTAEDGALVFRSAGYAVRLGRHQLALPAWASPGVCTVIHTSLGPERFSFTLALDHPLAGRLVFQVAEFVETFMELRQ